MKKLGWILLVVFIAIQFIRPAKNVSTAAPVNDIASVSLVPDDVNQILHKACYDCHSDNTHYPWYANIQPVYWWMDHHVDEGKDELNFSAWGTYKLKRKLRKYVEISEQVTEGEMPLESYTWMHADAKLSREEANLVINWANEMARKLQQDSLIVSVQ
ncbi:heme-binding domain-containing protein [Rurimicrobium arvi]|uniref:Haem-binding domain-containing protein n=1 Tax=Rurimicrobium arvi TaxID=2049916 RepID=A0ABP8MSG3_9BACT